MIGHDMVEALGKLPQRARLVRINAGAIADAHLGVVPNASLLLVKGDDAFEVLTAGSTSQVDAQIRAQPDSHPKPLIELTLRDQLVMPALVNAHTHLDLTHIGPQGHHPKDGFMAWVDMIRAGRRLEDDEIREATLLGVAKSLLGGVAAVGDIAGAPAGRLTDAPALALAESPMIGVSYLEFFGIGTAAPGAIKKIDAYLSERYPAARAQIADRGVTIGLQPHAPNTVDLGVYRWAARAAASHAMPLSTHLAETPEEREFIAQGTGPQREFIERFGIWDDSVLDHVGKGRRPAQHLRSVLENHRFLVAHVNDATDEAIETLASTRTSVAYCPRASAYFGAQEHFGTHRYLDMLAAGVNVCLGTDSIVNLDTPDRMSVLDDMRLLSARDHAEPTTLIAMATTNGARALGLEERAFTLGQGARPRGLIAVDTGHEPSDPWRAAMSRDEAPRWVFLREK